MDDNYNKDHNDKGRDEKPTHVENHDVIDKDTIIIKSRKVSIWRIVFLTAFIMMTLFFSLQYVLNILERSICESNLIAFRNSVKIYEQLHNGYPESLEELEDKVGLMGHIDRSDYKWVPATDYEPPILICLKFNIMSTDIVSNK